jgi:putative transcriptional regulator
VVLICEHSDEGALGLVLNRPGDVAVSDAAAELVPLAGSDTLIDIGGPVQPDALLVLAEFDDPEQDAGMHIIGSLGIMGDRRTIEELVESTERVRVFAGYAGWGRGQLDAELDRDDWFVAPAGIDDIFDTNAELLWQRVLERKGGHYALVARMPVDPSVN